MTTRARPSLLVLALILCTFTARMASARGPSTQEERDKAVALVHLLETDWPLSGAETLPNT